jgi:hypothetical protein
VLASHFFVEPLASHAMCIVSSSEDLALGGWVGKVCIPPEAGIWEIQQVLHDDVGNGPAYSRIPRSPSYVGKNHEKPENHPPTSYHFVCTVYGW